MNIKPTGISKFQRLQKLFLMAMFLLGIGCGNLLSQATIIGSISNWDGTVPPAALALWREDSDHRHIYNADRDGLFELSSQEAGTLSLWFSGANHTTTRVWVTLGDVDTIRLHLRLPTANYKDSINNPVVVQYRQADTVELPMAKTSEGRWKAMVAVENGMVQYQLANVAAGIRESDVRTFNGTQSDSYIYDGGGDFISVLHSDDDSVQIVFDPALLPPESQPASVEFDCGDCIAPLAYRYLQDMDAYQASTPERRRLLIDSLHAGITAYESLDTKTVTLNVMRLARLGDTTIPAPVARAVLDRSGPASLAWSLGAERLYRIQLAAGFTKAERDSFEYALFDTHRDSNLIAHLLFRAIDREKMAKNEKRAQELLGRLLTDYSSNRWAFRAASVWSKDAPHPGSTVPPFQIDFTDGTRLTNSSILGKITALYFWGTWCGPCRKFTPAFVSLSNKFKDRGVQFVGIAVADDPKLVQEYVTTNGVPWPNSVLPDFNAEILKSFYVAGVPKTYVIDKTETFQAVHSTPEELDTILEKLVAGERITPTSDQ
ncbi:MAG: TlpA family protein disulfide reductase [Armatimonadetes bacterium]|nr:TlpA family protein disulfide reductase [Armatimonadota bacterium]